MDSSHNHFLAFRKSVKGTASSKVIGRIPKLPFRVTSKPNPKPTPKPPHNTTVTKLKRFGVEGHSFQQAMGHPRNFPLFHLGQLVIVDSNQQEFVATDGKRKTKKIANHPVAGLRKRRLTWYYLLEGCSIAIPEPLIAPINNPFASL